MLFNDCYEQTETWLKSSMKQYHLRMSLVHEIKISYYSTLQNDQFRNYSKIECYCYWLGLFP